MTGRNVARVPPITVHGQAGMALVMVLWLVMLISIMAAGFSYAMRTETWLTIHQVDSAQARNLAEAGLWLAVADLLKPPQERYWPADGTPVAAEFGEATISLSIQDEAGKIDLNEADPVLLLGLLEAASAAGDDVTFLRNAILDWRDPDHDRRVPGAEDSDYLPAGYDAKDGPFNSIEELRRVAGMTDEIYGKISHAVTIHSLQPGVNPVLAPRIVLEAVPGGDSTEIDEYLASRHSRDGAAGITAMGHHHFNASQGHTCTIVSTATAGRSTLTLVAVVELDKDVNPPYSVLEWSESTLHYEHP